MKKIMLFVALILMVGCGRDVTFPAMSTEGDTWAEDMSEDDTWTEEDLEAELEEDIGIEEDIGEDSLEVEMDSTEDTADVPFDPTVAIVTLSWKGEADLVLHVAAELTFSDGPCTTFVGGFPITPWYSFLSDCYKMKPYVPDWCKITLAGKTMTITSPLKQVLRVGVYRQDQAESIITATVTVCYGGQCSDELTNDLSSKDFWELGGTLLGLSAGHVEEDKVMPDFPDCCRDSFGGCTDR